MPYLDSGSQDDVLVFDATQEFTGGMDTYNSSRLIAQNQTASLVNVDIDRDGAALTRLGSEDWGPVFTGNSTNTEIQGLGFLNTNTRTDLICAKDGKLWYQESQTPDVAWTRILNDDGSAFSLTYTTGQVYFAQLEGKMFFSDGVAHLMYIAPASNGLGSLRVFTIPTDPIAGWRRPERMKYIVPHVGRLIGVDSNYPDTIRVSEILDASAIGAWNSTNDVAVGGDGDAITGISPWTGTRLVIFKRNATYVLECEDADPAKWIVQMVDSSVGCASHRSIARVGADVYWLSSNGVRTLRRTLSGTEQEVSEPLSKPISSLTDRITTGTIESAAGAYYDNRYILQVPEGLGRFVIVYNTITKSWSGKWVGMEGLCWTRYVNGAIDHLMFGMANGKVRRWLGNKSPASVSIEDYRDAGVSYETQVLTREYTFGDFLSEKSPFNIEVEFYNSNSLVDVSIIKDSGVAVPVFSGIASSNLGLTLPFYLDANAILSLASTRRRAASIIGTGQFRGIQILVKISSGKLGLRGVSTSAYIDPYRVEK